MAGLSLCRIVRDEAELLPRFLDHARGLWDELVAVDTGSCDASLRLLAEGRDSDLELDLEPAEANRALRELVALLRRAARPEVKAALERGAPALAPAFPWIASAFR